MKTVVVTGATSGIGFAVCAELLKSGSHVIGVGRSEENCASAKEKLHAIDPNYDVTFVYGDLMQQPEILRVAAAIRNELELNGNGELSALVSNADACAAGI